MSKVRTSDDVITESTIADLACRYMGVGLDLNNDQREILLFALFNENKRMGGRVYRIGWERMQRKIKSARLETDEKD